jgi:hypothetical protein
MSGKGKGQELKIGLGLTLLGIIMAVFFSAFTYSLYRKVLTWTVVDLPIVRWIPYHEDSNGSYNAIEGDPAAADGESHNHITYSGVAYLKLPGGDSLKIEEGVDARSTRPKGPVTLRIYRNPDSQTEYMRFSPVFDNAFMAAFLGLSVLALYFGILLIRNSRRPAADG